MLHLNLSDKIFVCHKWHYQIKETLKKIEISIENNNFHAYHGKNNWLS